MDSMPQLYNRRLPQATHNCNNIQHRQQQTQQQRQQQQTQQQHPQLQQQTTSTTTNTTNNINNNKHNNKQRQQQQTQQQRQLVCMRGVLPASTMLIMFKFFPGEASTACPCRFCIAFLAIPFLARTCNPRMSNHAMCGVPSRVARRRVWCRRHLGLHDPVARVLQQRIPQIRIILPGVLLLATKT